MRGIDLNCDCGEGSDQDAALIALVSSANIACGAHAGNEDTMRSALRLAQEHGVAVGAHPGFEDPEHFGRRERAVTPGEVYRLILEQTRRLQALGASCGARVGHVKPHGALYNQAARDPALARAVAEAVRDADPRLVLFGLANSELVVAGRAAGVSVAQEVFADRRYEADGTLTPRTAPDALIVDEEEAVTQVLRMVREGRVRSRPGDDVSVEADTVCVHGDGPAAVAFARRLRRELARAGVEVRSHRP